MARHKLSLIIGILVVVLMAVALPGCISQSTHDTLQAAYDRVFAEYGNFQEAFGDIQEVYNELKAEYVSFNDTYADLQKAYDDFASLVAKYENFENISDLQDLQDAYDELKADYQDFQKTYADVQKLFDELQQDWENLTALLGLNE